MAFSYAPKQLPKTVFKGGVGVFYDKVFLNAIDFPEYPTRTIQTFDSSIDMAKNDYFGHINLIGRNPEERLMQEGIYYSICNENIIAGYGTAILSVHGWFNSADHRRNILSSECRYTGAGFYHYSKSSYKTYITQIYYR
jgi:hypothetical protein